MLEYFNKQERVDNYFFIFLFITLVFGVVLYDFIGFNGTDEILAAYLVAVFLFKMLTFNVNRIKPLLYLFLIFFFYLVYSFAIKSNITKAILSDFVVQIKPFLGFFCVYAISPKISDQHKYILRKTCYIICFYLFIVGIQGDKAIFEYFGHYSRFATCAVAISFTYLIVSDFNKRNIIKAILLCAVGLLSTRAKFFGFFALYSFLLYWIYNNRVFKINIKSIIYGLVALVVVILLSWNKINYYFIDGMFESEEAFARPVLYMTSYDIFKDYFPFGSGFASFATYFSAVDYSKIYELYDIENFYGLTYDDPAFVADTFYPSLAQFGVVGLLLYIYFFVYIIRSVPKYIFDYPDDDLKYYALIYSGIVFFLIESVADSTFIHNRGFYILSLMGMSLSYLQDKRECNSDLSKLKSYENLCN